MNLDDLTKYAKLVDILLTTTNPEVSKAFGELMVQARLMGTTEQMQNPNYFGFSKLTNLYIDQRVMADQRFTEFNEERAAMQREINSLKHFPKCD
jgi:hypothetical protein